MAGEAKCGGMAGRALTGLEQRDINQRPLDMSIARASALYLARSTWLAKDREAGAIESERLSLWAGEERLRDRLASSSFLAIACRVIGAIRPLSGDLLLADERVRP